MAHISRTTLRQKQSNSTNRIQPLLNSLQPQQLQITAFMCSSTNLQQHRPKQIYQKLTLNPHAKLHQLPPSHHRWRLNRWHRLSYQINSSAANHPAKQSLPSRNKWYANESYVQSTQSIKIILSIQRHLHRCRWRWLAFRKTSV